MPAWSNWVVELSGNPLILHCMPAWSNWVSSHGFSPNLIDSTRHHLNGFPPNLTRHDLNGFPPNSTIISVDFYPIQPVIDAWSNQSNLTNVRAFESSSQWISTQIDRFDQASSQWIETDQIQPIRPGIISMDFHPI